MGRGAQGVRGRVGRDAGLIARMVLTVLLLAALDAAFAWALVWLGAPWWAVVVAVPVLVVLQMAFTDPLAFGALRARPVTPEELPALHAAVERLCALHDIRKPRLAVCESRLPTAFTTGPDRRSQTLCVTTGLLARLEPPELEAVLAHELAHVASRDALVMAWASSLTLEAGAMVRAARGGGGGPVPVFIILLPLTGTVYAVGLALVRLLSRDREYAADRAAAIMTGAPARLAAALLALDDAVGRAPTGDLRAAQGLNPLLVLPVPAYGIAAWAPLRTHPPTGRRVARQVALQAAHDARAAPAPAPK